MKLTRLEVRNFKGIVYASLNNLASTVVIAGPNGCGKSCLLDAIRLLKSTYGGYQPNEFYNWFGEFQIDLNRHRGQQVLTLLRDRTQELVIRATVSLTAGELQYLQREGGDVVRELLWKHAESMGLNKAPARGALAEETEDPRLKIDSRTVSIMNRVGNEANGRTEFEAQIIVSPNGKVTTNPSVILELVFSIYEPQFVGIVDYHGADRTYDREKIGGINLNIESSEERLRQSALYNWRQKYQNIRSELAASYVRRLMAEDAGSSTDGADDLLMTLDELFKMFFPGKKFLGPKPDVEGRLSFPVRLSDGSMHDINDLSSGEKEVLFGYLRLRNSAPRNSILLLDEPELHLNPRLVRGLPQFYHRHLGQNFNNQIWLVTHSDAFLGEAVGQPEFSVFHMSEPQGNHDQIHSIQDAHGVDKAIIDLVGQFASYRPGAKVVVFEGGGESDFDIRMTRKLFPDFFDKVNPISGGGKRRVQQLHSLLQAAAERTGLPVHFYAVTDADYGSAASIESAGVRVHQWDVYHIENYLLESRFVLRVLESLNLEGPRLKTDAEVDEALKACAKETLDGLVRRRLQELAGNALHEALRTDFAPEESDLVAGVREAATRSNQRIENLMSDALSEDRLKEFERRERAQLTSALSDGSWRRLFRGRDILKRFVSEHGRGIDYENFRNLVIAQMSVEGFSPPGMAAVLKRIVEADIEKNGRVTGAKNA